MWELVVSVSIGLIVLLLLYQQFFTWPQVWMSAVSPTLVDSTGVTRGPGDNCTVCKGFWGQACGNSEMGGRSLDQQCGSNWTESIQSMPTEFQRLLDDPRYCGNWILYAPGFDYFYHFDQSSKQWVQTPLTDSNTASSLYAYAMLLFKT